MENVARKLTRVRYPLIHKAGSYVVCHVGGNADQTFVGYIDQTEIDPYASKLAVRCTQSEKPAFKIGSLYHVHVNHCHPTAEEDEVYDSWHAQLHVELSLITMDQGDFMRWSKRLQEIKDEESSTL